MSLTLSKARKHTTGNIGNMRSPPTGCIELTPCALVPYARWRERCSGCGEPLVGRQRTWCSADCQEEYWRNHIWSWARTAALERDGNQCVKCGQKPVRRTPDHPDIDEIWLEVNHIDPLNGRGYHSGCWHHLSGLETLCHPCHVDVTNEQRAERNRWDTPLGRHDQLSLPL